MTVSTVLSLPQRGVACTLVVVTAEQRGRLDPVGTPEPGKRADFIIIDRNPLTVPVGEMHRTRLLATDKAEEKVFSAPEGETN